MGIVASDGGNEPTSVQKFVPLDRTESLAILRAGGVVDLDGNLALHGEQLIDGQSGPIWMCQNCLAAGLPHAPDPIVDVNLLRDIESGRDIQASEVIRFRMIRTGRVDLHAAQDQELRRGMPFDFICPIVVRDGKHIVSPESVLAHTFF